MSINVSCPSCGFAGRVPDDCRGRKVNCPKCNSSFLVPRAPGGDAILDALPAEEANELPRPVLMAAKAPPVLAAASPARSVAARLPIPSRGNPADGREPLKCLSLQQYFAWALCVGAKTVENRTWGVDYRGLVAIHAGLKKQRVNELVREVGKDKLRTGLFAYGAIIGVAELVDVAEMNASLENNPSAYGPICWLFRNGLLLPSPIPSKGKLQLYTLTVSESAQVHRQLPGLRNAPLGPEARAWVAAMRPDSVDQCMSRATIYDELGKTSDAIRNIDKAIQLDPANCGGAIALRGSLRIAQGDYRGGIANCDEAIRRDPEDAWAYLVRSDGYAGLGDQTRADADYEKAIGLDPSLAEEAEDGEADDEGDGAED